MAITPRSFRLNPKLLAVLAATVFAMWVVSWSPIGDADEVSFGSCGLSTNVALWTVDQWNDTVHCLLDQDAGSQAYQAASFSVLFYPDNSQLLNLKGYVAARNGDHATAIYDFRTGERITGSPTGVFENNIAWATLFRTEGLRFQRQERVLLQTRRLYERSLEKGQSCERLHTALFVEYKYADLVARNAGADDVRVTEAVDRYVDLFESYQACTDRTRLRLGGEVVVEELLSAAAMDAEMAQYAGVRSPTRHLSLAHSAKQRAEALGLPIDDEWCRRVTPVAAAAETCAEL